MPIFGSVFSKKSKPTYAQIVPITSSEERKLSEERKAAQERKLSEERKEAWQEPKKSGLVTITNGIRTSYGGKPKKTTKKIVKKRK